MKNIIYLLIITITITLSSCQTTANNGPVPADKGGAVEEQETANEQQEVRPDYALQTSTGSFVPADGATIRTDEESGLQRLAVILPDPHDASVKKLRYVETGQAFVQPDPGDSITVEAFDTDFIVSSDVMSFSIGWNITNTDDEPITIVEHKVWFRAGSHWDRMWLATKGNGAPSGETVTIDPGETFTNTSTFNFGSVDPLLSAMEEDGADPEYGVWFIPEFDYIVGGENEKNSYTPGLYLVAIDS